jgi:hypothetical protein
MGAQMKTTLDLADPLFHAAKALANEQQTTLRALVEEGLRLVLQQRQATPAKPFTLRDARFNGGQTVWPDSHEWRDLETLHLMESMNPQDKR